MICDAKGERNSSIPSFPQGFLSLSPQFDLLHWMERYELTSGLGVEKSTKDDGKEREERGGEGRSNCRFRASRQEGDVFAEEECREQKRPFPSVSVIWKAQRKRGTQEFQINSNWKSNPFQEGVRACYHTQLHYPNLGNKSAEFSGGSGDKRIAF